MSPLPPEQFVTFEVDGATLTGVLHPAADAVGADAAQAQGQVHAKPAVIIVVGGPQYRVGSHRQFLLLARALAAAGYPVLRFDYRGMGDADGVERGFEHVDDDIAAAIATTMTALPGLPGVVLAGLCDGASACLMYAHRDARVLGLVLANPWVRSVQLEARTQVKHYYAARLLQKSFWVKLLRGGVNLGGSIAGFLRALRRARGSGNGEVNSLPFQERMLRGLQEFDRPVLLLMSGRDLTAREFDDLAGQSAEWGVELRRERVRRVDLAGADHTFSGREDLSNANEVVVDWLAKG